MIETKNEGEAGIKPAKVGIINEWRGGDQANVWMINGLAGRGKS